MDPLTLAAVGTAVTGGLDQLTGWQNRAFAKKMYDRQRDDAIEFWNMQNEYNSPIKQKERLEEAGLNPALMYGKGAASGAVSGNAMGIKNPSPTSAQQMNNVKSLTSEIANVESARMMKMQTDLTSEKVEEQRIKNELARLRLPHESHYYGSDYLFGRDIQHAGGYEGFKVTTAQADKIRTEYLQLKALLEGESVWKGADRIAKAKIANMEATLTGKRYDNIKKEIDNALAKVGLSWSDSPDLRTIAVHLHNEGIISIPTYMALTGAGKFLIKMSAQLGSAGLISKGLSKTKSMKQLRGKASGKTDAQIMYENRPISGHIPFD